MNESSARSFSLEYDKSGIPILKYTENRSESRPIEEDEVSNILQDNTYIDWHKESSREPNTLATKKWLAIVLSAITLGYTTTFINLSSVWLNDLKKGICFSKIDNWTLLDPYLTCPADGWYSWSRLFFGATGVASNIFINSPIFIVLSCVMALIAAYISFERNQFIKQSGIPEIKLIISGLNYKVNEYLSLRTLIHKIIGLILVVSSGLWLGKEGPLIHISCCLQNIWYNFILGSRNTNEAYRRELLSAATATGISIAFNAPIGGVVFVLEYMPSYFVPTKIMWSSFISATVSVVVLTGFRFFTDGQNFYEQNLFQISFGNFSWLFMETIPFIGIGILGGFYGYFFIKLNSSIGKIRPSIQLKLSKIFKVERRNGPYIEIGLIILVTSILNFSLALTKLPLSAYLKILFTACPTDNSNTTSDTISGICQNSSWLTIFKLLFIAVQAFFLSAYTFGVNLPGGVLMPSLAIGATSGRLIGLIAQIIQSKINWDSFATCTETSCLVSPSSYAVIGAASFMTGVTKLTVSVVVILFELTGAITYILPIMLSVMVSKYVNDLLCNDNIYDNILNDINSKSDNNGSVCETNQGKGSGFVDFTDLNSSVKNKLPNLNVDSIMVPLAKTKCLCLIPDTPYTVSKLIDFVNDDVHDGYPVILSYAKPIYIGYMPKRRFLEHLDSIEVSNSIISFKIEGLSSDIFSNLSLYENTLDQSGIYHMSISPQKQYLRVNELYPIVLMLQMFEKMHLNHLVINSYDPKHSYNMVGFLDRFILSNLLKSGFESLVYADTMDRELQEFDLDHPVEQDELLDIREQRVSIELIT